MECDNVERKCEWEGTVGTLIEHMATCPFSLLHCPNECKDDNGLVNHFMRKYMNEHLNKTCPNRDYECQYCGEEGTYAEITEIHDKTCAKKILSCPNDQCTQTLERQKVDEHLRSECDYTVIPCKYEMIGCGMKRKRRDMAEHEEGNKQIHLNMAMDTTVELTKTLDVVTSKLHRQETNTFKMHSFDEYKELNARFNSRPFYSAPGGYLIAITVYANGARDGKDTHISVFAGIQEGKHDEELNWPFVGEIAITLLNQLEDDNHYTMTLDVTGYDIRGHSFGYIKFIPHTELGHNPIMNTQYLKDNTLHFRVAVKRPDCKPWLTN